MLTQCPQCRAIYRIRALELSAANGFVICDNCDTQFNALQRLADEPVATPALLPAVTIDAPTGLTVEHDALPPTEPLDDTIITEAIHNDQAPAGQAEVPAILRDDFARLERQSAGGLTRWLWRIFAIGALLALVLQVSWIFRDQLLREWPALRGAFEQTCAIFNCRVDAPHGSSGIELSAREIREHPKYRDALLVNATLVNRSATNAKYPLLQLGLYDHAGNVIGIRRFSPQEYLDASVDITRGIPPRRNLYVVLELANVKAVADSYEFTFF